MRSIPTPPAATLARELAHYERLLAEALAARVQDLDRRIQDDQRFDRGCRR